MFSEVQRNYVAQLVKSNYKEFPYYLAYTNTDVSRTGVYDDYNFFVILSKEAIKATGRYNYTIPSNSIMLGVRSSNASYSYYSERVVNQSAPSSLRLDNYEFVYTNAEFNTYQMQPDLLAATPTPVEHFDGVGIALLIILTSAVFFKLIRG